MSELFKAPNFITVCDCKNSTLYRLYTGYGQITVMDRMTGFGYRDIESGYHDLDGNFWLASGNVDVRKSGAETVAEAIEYIKSRANKATGEQTL